MLSVVVEIFIRLFTPPLAIRTFQPAMDWPHGQSPLVHGGPSNGEGEGRDGGTIASADELVAVALRYATRLSKGTSALCT